MGSRCYDCRRTHGSLVLRFLGTFGPCNDQTLWVSYDCISFGDPGFGWRILIILGPGGRFRELLGSKMVISKSTAMIISYSRISRKTFTERKIGSERMSESRTKANPAQKPLAGELNRNAGQLAGELNHDAGQLAGELNHRAGQLAGEHNHAGQLAVRSTWLARRARPDPGLSDLL